MTAAERETIEHAIKYARSRAEHYKDERDRLTLQEKHIFVYPIINDVLELHQAYAEMNSIANVLERLLEKFSAHQESEQ